jgi:hypothetical protein
LADFGRFFSFGTAPAKPLAWPPDGPGTAIGDKTMTISLNLQQLAISVIGALIASSLFISAAVGPVPVI